MKKVFVVIGVLAIGGVSYFIGSIVGRNNGFDAGYNSAVTMHNLRSIEEIQEELRLKESKAILQFIHGKGKLDLKDEGGLFKVKLIPYFDGEIINSALLAKTKDIKVKIDFLSKTGTRIASDEFTVFEFLGPGESYNFRKKLNFTGDPKDIESFEFRFTSAENAD